MKRPTNKKDLQTFLGVINFMRPFINNLSELAMPMHELLKKNIAFIWTENQEQAMKKIKEGILTANILVPFDESKEIIVQCDASQNGLGCCILQNNMPISFASRTLTANERNYSQIEKLRCCQYCLRVRNFTIIRMVEG